MQWKFRVYESIFYPNTLRNGWLAAEFDTESEAYGFIREHENEERVFWVERHDVDWFERRHGENLNEVYKLEADRVTLWPPAYLR